MEPPTSINFEPNHVRKVKMKRASEKTDLVLEKLLPGSDQVDTFDVTIPDLPHPDLVGALQHMMYQYIDCLDLPDEYASRIHITGMKIHGFEPPEVTVYGERDLTMGQTLNQSTPKAPLVTQDLVGVCNTVVTEALLFAQGKRASLNLFEDFSEGNGAPEDAEQLPEESETHVEGVETTAALEE